MLRLGENPPAGRRVLNRKGLEAKGVRYTPQHLGKMVREGRFPAPFRLNGPTSPSLWYEDVIDAHLDEKSRAAA